MRNRSGATSLAELVMVAAFFGLVLAGIATFAGQQARLAALQQDRVRFEDAVRTGELILGGELRHLTGDDLTVGDDSVRIRAFRGGGPICSASGGTLLVEYAGTRMPEPDKDSVLVVGLYGEQVVAFSSAIRSDLCGGSVDLALVDPADLSVSIGSWPAVALVFETGSYHLADGAVRYRRGQGGRQPLTEVLLGDMGFHGESGAVRARMAPHPDSLPRLPPGSRSARSFVFRSLNSPEHR